MIETERLTLRLWRDGDAAEFARITNTPAVMRWLGGVLPPDRMAEATDRYARWQEERDFTFWIVERRGDRELLGFCGLKYADALGSSVLGEVEIGWRFREDAWGRGYAREAATASLDFAFARTDRTRVIAVTVAGNRASWTLMQRLGMRHMPELDYSDPRYGTELNPAIVYAITRSEWADRRA